MAMTQKANGRLTGFASIVSGVLVPLVLYCLFQVAEMGGNRFTAHDGRQLQKEISHEISRIWQELKALPPDEFEAKVDKAVEKVHALELALVRLQGELEKLRK